MLNLTTLLNSLTLLNKGMRPDLLIIYLNNQPLEVVSRYHDPQLQTI